jgi:DNA primase
VTVEELLVKKDISFGMKGKDYIVSCLNPEHDDSNPSMRVDQVTGIFNCFSCGYKGNLFFLYEEKVNQLQLNRELLKRKIAQKRSESVGLLMPKGAEPYSGDWRGLKPETYTKFQAFQHHDPDFIGRIVFPIFDISGNIVAFNGRHTSNGIPKYKISPAGAKMPLYPKVNARSGKIILVEGIYDMLNLHDKGLTNAVCCFGTKNVNEAKLQILRMQGAEGVDVFFDGDDAGQKAAKTIIDMCEKVGLITRNVHLSGTDPGELSETQVIKLARKLYA